MKKIWSIPLIILIALLMFGSFGGIFATFADPDTSSSNRLITANWWIQDSQVDFNAGTLNNADTSVNPGDVLLSLVPNLTLITSDNSTVQTSSADWQLVKTLNFNKSGGSPSDIRIDSNLKASSTYTAYSSIRVDDVEQFTHETTSTSYVDYQDTLDFSSYSDGAHTVELYLQVSKKNKLASNSVFELYRTKMYPSSGTIASQVYDSTITGAAWDELQWSEALDSGTDIIFEVRSSDTSFAKDDLMPSWEGLGTANSPISLSNTGRYIQCRATLSTTNTSVTPTLSDITVYYTSTT